MNARTAQFDDLRLVALPTAVNCTDLFVRFTLAEWCLQSMLDDVTDTANRLVKHAVAGADPKTPGIIAVRLRLRGDNLIVEIEGDGGQTLEVPPGLAEQHAGVTSLDNGGQIVWCELPLPGGTDAYEVPLPRRGTTKPVPIEPRGEDESAEMDPQVMERILAALAGAPEKKTAEKKTTEQKATEEPADSGEDTGDGQGA